MNKEKEIWYKDIKNNGLSQLQNIKKFKLCCRMYTSEYEELEDKILKMGFRCTHTQYTNDFNIVATFEK